MAGFYELVNRLKLPAQAAAASIKTPAAGVE
jgi:hypothetical protein